MSGGVDSPLIASSLRELDTGEVLPAFSVASTDGDIDESASARRHATTIGLPLHSSLMTDDAAHGLFEDVMSCTTEPLADEGIFPALIVSHAASRQVRVALSGDGADELFWGYVQRQCPFLRGVDDSSESGWSRYASFFVEMDRTEFESCFPDVPWFESGHPLFDPARSPIHQAYALRRYEMETYLQSILLKTDRAGMFHSLEVRMPFLDREVIDVALRLRWDDCLDVDRAIGKRPLRRLQERRGLFPPHQKKGFTVPLDRWLRGCLKDRVGERLRQTGNLAGVRIDVGSVMRLWDEHQRGHVERGAVLWRLFLLSEWLARHTPGAASTATQ
jgi:asparagine synthase (glutamine-hydrolysing)